MNDKKIEMLRLILIGHFMEKEDLNFDKSMEIINNIDEIMPIITDFL